VVTIATISETEKKLVNQCNENNFM